MLWTYYASFYRAVVNIVNIVCRCSKAYHCALPLIHIGLHVDRHHNRNAKEPVAPIEE